ncbi:MAG: T9SS type A sorting domain-containing protein [candidate division KSB1 bacterium]|nr:T9SS type A sorting domain-containing protein [candidate division KSB1 bacterium]MDZ7346368.1 T9SS type A sorting domain-containing protein [candidate division KSB1 bacterium]
MMKKHNLRYLLPAALALLVLFTGVQLVYSEANRRAELAKPSEFMHAQFNANTIANWLANDGLIVSHRKTGNSGMEWPKGSKKTIDFASGIWFAGKDADGVIRTAAAEYSSEFVPGPWGSDPNDKANRIYIINSDGTGDWDSWPVAQGAPVTADGKPKLFGDQTIFWVMNDGNAAQHANVFSTQPMGLEVKCTVFGFNKADPLGNIMFMKFEVENKGGLTLDSCYVALWDDPDLGDASDDLVGCDTTLSLGFCYNGKPVDATYGTTPPAIGMDFFQGPKVGDAYMPMTSFVYYWNGAPDPFGDPEDANQMYFFMKGLTGDGSPYLDHTGNPTKFVFAGDPVTKSGHLDSNPADRRFLMSSGPFTLKPGDKQVIVGSKIIAPGTDNLAAVNALRFFDSYAQNAFDNDFDLPQPPAPVVAAAQEDGKIILSWQDEAGTYQKIESYEKSGYKFEGYNIYQGESVSGPWKLIATFDVVSDFGIIFDNTYDAATGMVLNKPVAFGSNSGITRHIVLDKDKLTGEALYNYKKYYYSVTSYAVNGEVSPKVAESGHKPIMVMPYKAPLGIEAKVKADDLIRSVHSKGVSDGNVIGKVVDALKLTGHTYQVTFKETEEGYVWSLKDKNTGKMLVEDNPNQTGDEDYPIIDGMKVYVTGPPPGMKDWQIPEGSTRRFTWAGADGFHFEGFNGAIGWAQPSTFFGSGYNYPASKLKNVMLVLAKVDKNGNFDPNDPNVSYGYRYMRRAAAPPAKPEFAPFILNPSGGYAYQEFAKNVPLAAFDIENPDKPRRLAVMFMENNVEGGLVDGKWFPGPHTNYDNTASTGPREWLFILDVDYSETPNPDYFGDLTQLELPIMWWLAVNRRGEAEFSPGGTGQDKFVILANHINSENDVFELTPPAPVRGPEVAKLQLDRINAVPNPYWAWSPNETQPTQRIIRFTNMPANGATIRIFDLAGNLVRVITDADRQKQGSLGTAYAEWDVRNAADVPVASGMYIVHIEIKDVGEKILKLAVINRDERLLYY